MAYDTVATSYVQCKVMEVEQNIDVAKAQGGGTYKGTSITVKVNGKAETISMAQKWLDVSYQADLKAKIATLKPGQEITIVKVKKTGNIDLAAYNALDKDTQKTMSNWGVGEILDGHVAPQQSRPAAGGSNSGGQTYGKFDTSEIERAHAQNASMIFLGGKTTAAKIAETCEVMHDMTIALKAEYMAANPDLSEKTVGNMVGGAVLHACTLAVGHKKEITDIPALARKFLVEVTERTDKYIKAKKAAPAPKAEEPAVEEAPEAPAAEDFDDDIPF